MKIYAPNSDYTGETAGVAFVNGVAEVDEKAEENRGRVRWFREHGFGMGSKKDADEGLRRQAQNLKGSAKPLSELTRPELNEVALGKGILGAAAMSNKDEVIEAIRAAGGADAEDQAIPAYLTKAEAEGRLKDRFGLPAAEATVFLADLETATSELDSLAPFEGERAEAAQVLEFPRSGEGIPDAVLDWVALRALQLGQAEDDAPVLEERKLDASVKYARPSESRLERRLNVAAKVVSAHVSWTGTKIQLRGFAGTIHRPGAPTGTKDGYGNPKQGAPQQIPVRVYTVRRKSYTELLDGRQTLTTRVEAALRPGPDVRETDELEHGGVRYKVTGVFLERFPGGKPSHIHLDLEAVS